MLIAPVQLLCTVGAATKFVEKTFMDGYETTKNAKSFLPSKVFRCTVIVTKGSSIAYLPFSIQTNLTPENEGEDQELLFGRNRETRKSKGDICRWSF